MSNMSAQVTLGIDDSTGKGPYGKVWLHLDLVWLTLIARMLILLAFKEVLRKRSHKNTSEGPRTPSEDNSLLQRVAEVLVPEHLLQLYMHRVAIISMLEWHKRRAIDTSVFGSAQTLGKPRLLMTKLFSSLTFETL